MKIIAWFLDANNTKGLNIIGVSSDFWNKNPIGRYSVFCRQKVGNSEWRETLRIEKNVATDKSQLSILSLSSIFWNGKRDILKLKLYSDYFETEVSSDETHMSVWYKIQC